MASAAHNTKIELVTEAFENLALATAASVAHSGKRVTGTEKFITDIADARKQMRDALADLLKPTLRVVG